MFFGGLPGPKLIWLKGEGDLGPIVGNGERDAKVLDLNTCLLRAQTSLGGKGITKEKRTSE